MKFGRESVGDDVLKSTGCLSVERPSSKKALLIFDSAEAAVQCAIDEEFGAQFKDVKLKTSDAWERIREAVAARAAKDRADAPELASSGRDGADREAERSRLLREAASVKRPRGDAAAKRVGRLSGARRAIGGAGAACRGAGRRFGGAACPGAGSARKGRAWALCRFISAFVTY